MAPSRPVSRKTGTHWVAAANAQRRGPKVGAIAGA